MSEVLNQQAMKINSRSSINEDKEPESDMMKGLERRGSVPAPGSQLEKIVEFFQICDNEGKGYITPTDMRVKNRKYFGICVWGKMKNFPCLIFTCYFSIFFSR